jgi:ring-1,2-phenylacetyl-CoA epoxidase subunit PaaE
LANGLLAAGKVSQFDMFYCNQNTARTLCADEVLALKDRYPENFAVHFLMTREPQEFELLNGRLDSEKLTDFCARVVQLDAADQVFMSGPGDMMANLTQALIQLGLDEQIIHSEHYSLESVANSAPLADSPQIPKSSVDDSVSIEAVIDGRRRAFPLEEGETLLEAGLNAGVELPFSCCAGVCSTCRTKVVEGEVVMDENYALEEWEVEQGYVLACQSRPVTSKVVLDYDER